MKRPLLRPLAALTLCAPSLATAAALDIDLRDGAGNPVADAAVLVRDTDGSTPTTGLVIDQIDRRFVPRAAIVPVGSAVGFPNKDNIRHHVYSFSPAKTFELKLYSGTPATPVVFDQPGIVVLGCNIHDGMIAYVYVVDTAQAALSDAQGRAQLADVAPGALRLDIWHPQLREPLSVEVPASRADGPVAATLMLDDASVAPPPLD